MPTKNAPARMGEGVDCQLAGDSDAHITGPAPDQFSATSDGVRPGPILRRHWLRFGERTGMVL